MNTASLRASVSLAALLAIAAQPALAGGRTEGQGEPPRYDGPPPKVYARDAVIFGRTYGDWSAAWRQWADSLPAAKHPLFDTADCGEGQSGPVWFLGGSFCGSEQESCPGIPGKPPRECKLPAGKAIYFPIVNTACLDGEAAKGQCLEAGPLISQMRATLANLIDQTTGLAVVWNGRVLVKSDLKTAFRMQSTVYPTLLPDGNLYQALGEPNIVAGSYIGVDDGVYLMLEPLRKGDYLLNFKGYFPQFDFQLDMTYKLEVE